jgi:hypothetical protein
MWHLQLKEYLKFVRSLRDDNLAKIDSQIAIVEHLLSQAD